MHPKEKWDRADVETYDNGVSMNHNLLGNTIFNGFYSTEKASLLHCVVLR